MIDSDRSWRRLDALLFVTLFLAYAYFFQGGGWNQNARLDQAAAIVEYGRLSIDRNLVHHRPGRSGPVGELARGELPPKVPLDWIGSLGNTGDVARHDGRLYPNKPPGVALAAVPGRLVAGWLFGGQATWRGYVRRAYLTSVLSVGLAGALAGLGFARLGRRLFADAPPPALLAAALSFGLGTMMLPYSTMLHDHVFVAACLLWSLVLLVDGRGGGGASAGWRLPAAGLLLGAGVAFNYLVLPCLPFLAVYVLATYRRPLAVLWLALGAVLPGVLLAWYHHACFGAILTTPNRFQSPTFLTEGLVLGVFGAPDPAILGKLLFSPYRGLFHSSPVLLAAVAGWIVAARRRTARAEALLAAAVLGGFLLFNMSFVAEGWAPWSGGWNFGPRYLIPGMALLALGLVPAFQRAPRITASLAVVSAAIMLLATAVDPQPSTGIERPLGEHIWPLFRGEQISVLGQPLRGVVSANPIGVYEGWFYRVFPPGSAETRWSSFNLGELAFGESRLSLLPYCALVALSLTLGLRATRQTAALQPAGDPRRSPGDPPDRRSS